MKYKELLPNEKLASDFVMKIGVERANRILDSICKRFDRRYNKACDDNKGTPINREWIYRTKIEIELTHIIKTGLTLNDTYNTPQAARKRILDRINKRNEARRVRKLAA